MKKNHIIILVSGIVTITLLLAAVYFISLAVNKRDDQDIETTEPVSTTLEKKEETITTMPEPEKTYTEYPLEILNNSAAYELKLNYFFDEGRLYVETGYYLDGASREHLILQNDLPEFTKIFSAQNTENDLEIINAVLNTKHNKIYMIAKKERSFALYVYSLKDNSVKLLDKGEYESLRGFQFSTEKDYVVYNYVQDEKDNTISIFGCTDDKVIVSMNKTSTGNFIGKIDEDPLNESRVFSFTFSKWTGPNELELEEYSYIPGSGSETTYKVRYNFVDDKVIYPKEKPVPETEETTEPVEEETEEEPVVIPEEPVEEETTEPTEPEESSTEEETTIPVEEEPVEVPNEPVEEETTEPPEEEAKPEFDPDSVTLEILKSFYEYAAGGEYEKAYELFDDSFTTQSKMFMGFKITKAEVPLDFFIQFSEGTGIFKGVKIQEIFKEERINGEAKIFYTQSLALEPGKDPQIFPLIATLIEKDGIYRITRVDDAIF